MPSVWSVGGAIGDETIKNGSSVVIASSIYASVFSAMKSVEYYVLACVTDRCIVICLYGRVEIPVRRWIKQKVVRSESTREGLVIIVETVRTEQFFWCSLFDNLLLGATPGDSCRSSLPRRIWDNCLPVISKKLDSYGLSIQKLK